MQRNSRYINDNYKQINNYQTIILFNLDDQILCSVIVCRVYKLPYQVAMTMSVSCH